MKFWLLITLLIINTMLTHVSIRGADFKNLEVKFNLRDRNISLEQKLLEHSKKISEYLIRTSDNDVDYLTHEALLSFKKFLYSLGYFSAKVECNFVNLSKNSQITCIINTGSCYTLKDATITLIPDIQGKTSVVKLPPLQSLDILIGKQVIAKEILNAQEEIEKSIEENNCLLNLRTSHELLINKNNNTAIINYYVQAGEVAYFNHVIFNGLDKVNKDYAYYLSGLEIPSCFQKSKIAEAKENLQKSGLFTSVETVLPDKTGKDGAVDINFNLVEQKRRTAKLGIKYTTDLGIALNGDLIHRNLFGEGQKLSTKLTVSKQLQLLDSSYEIPYFLQKNQKFRLQNIIKRENQEAYNNKEISILAGIEKPILPPVTIGAGIKYGINRVIDEYIARNYAFLSFPLFIVYDLRDNIIDPQKGFLSKFDVTPYINSLNNKENFLKYRISGSCYIPINKHNSTILALRANFGSIGKLKTINIPINERFFAGGATSIRGYRYQTAGPLNTRNRPIGGTSIIELTSELRFKINDTIGFATFIDAGNVFHTKMPKINNKLFFGMGFGIRYYTSFGPIRADIAFPLHKRRHKVDNILQLYFSIGQAF